MENVKWKFERKVFSYDSDKFPNAEELYDFEKVDFVVLQRGFIFPLVFSFDIPRETFSPKLLWDEDSFVLRSRLLQ